MLMEDITSKYEKGFARLFECLNAFIKVTSDLSFSQLFAAYAFIVGVLFAIIFKENRKETINKSEAAEKNGLAAGGIIDDKDQI